MMKDSALPIIVLIGIGLFVGLQFFAGGSGSR